MNLMNLTECASDSDYINDLDTFILKHYVKDKVNSTKE